MLWQKSERLWGIDSSLSFQNIVETLIIHLEYALKLYNYLSA